MAWFARSAWSPTGWRWPPGGLLLVAAILGHGLLMAAETQAALPAGHAAGEHEPAGPTSATGAVGAVPDDAPAPHHPAGCEVTHAAAPRTGGDPDLVASAAAPLPSTAPGPSLAPPLAGGWVEPIWPPGVRRAFFQVYRI
jgi:hypothetical protein